MTGVGRLLQSLTDSNGMGLGRRRYTQQTLRKQKGQNEISGWVSKLNKG